MSRLNQLVFVTCLLHAALAVKVKLVFDSDQDESYDETHPTTVVWNHKRVTNALPFLKKVHKHIEPLEEEEEKPTTEKSPPLHLNSMIFPLLYRQEHINSMFKYDKNWYTWSTEKRADGTKGINYYICYEEPKHCDEVGWDRTTAVPRCAFQIDALLNGDRACINSFGIEPHNSGTCDGAEQMKVSDIVQACGPRIRSLWRFMRVGRRSANAAKPADINSLICDDEDECYITIEYRIHHDRITFSVHEPTRGQTFKSALKREVTTEEESKPVSITESHKNKKKEEEHNIIRTKKFRKAKVKVAEGKGVVKERNDSGYANHKLIKNVIKFKEDLSEDISE